jgi:cytochrome P450
MPTPLPPGPSSLLLAMPAYLRDPIGWGPAAARRYGDTFTLPGATPLVITGDPAGIKQIYGADPDTFTPHVDNMEFLLGGGSLILVGGAAHRRLRRLLAPPFQGARMRAYGRAILDRCAAATSTWREGQTVAVHHLAQRISLDIILSAVFGVHDPAAMAELAQRLHSFVDRVSPLIVLFPALRRELGGVGPYAAFTRRRRELFAAFDRRIAEAREHPPGDDMLSLLVHTRDEEGRSMSDQEIREQLLLFVVAGHETTAIAVAWAVYALHRPENRHALDRLRAELHPLGPAPEPDALAALPYLDAVCQEALRRYPLALAPSPRRLLRPFELMGHTLQPGVAVAAAIGVAHLRELTFEGALAFRPERFLDRKYSPFEFLPYGGGARRCLGAPLASYELRLIVGALLAGRRLRLASQRPDRGRVRAANVGPAHGVRVIVEAP